MFDRHRATFEAAQRAVASRACWSPFPEMPGKYPDADHANAAALSWFEAQRGRPFALTQPGIVGAAGEEVSPYTQERLGIAYPQSDPDALFAAARAAMPRWAEAAIDTRLGVLMECLDRIYREHLFQIVQAVMHTAGQSFNMAYAGSGVNALDRGIEVLVHAEAAMRFTPPAARWERRFGAAEIALEKTYRIVPRGVAVCFACASFPTWNAWPSILASLATGNAVIVKPHPASVLPMAITVRAWRAVLAEAGFDPNLLTLCLDTQAEPLGKSLIKHPDCAIVDFTGSARFGAWVEANAHPALAFTETSGVNTVVIQGAQDLDAALRSLATTMCLFSGQMCTSPQTIYLPPQVATPQGPVPRETVARRLAQAIARLAEDPAKAAAILAAIQSPATLELLARLREDPRARVLLDSRPYRHPDFPAARTATPLLLAVEREARDLYATEQFGPVGFVVACDSPADALDQATRDAAENGGITGFVYAIDEGFIAAAEAAYATAGAQLTVNLTGPMPLNFAAAYSDYHVTGLNGAGNATLTTLAFVAGRFGIAQSRRPAGERRVDAPSGRAAGGASPPPQGARDV